MSSLGRQTTMFAKFQSAFATIPSGNWQPLSCYDNSLVQSQALEDDPLLGRGTHNGRDPFEPAPGLPTVGGGVTVPMCFNEIGWWLKNTFGAPETDASDDPDFVHVFKSGGTTIPPLALMKKIKADDWRIIKGAKVNTINVKAEKAGGFPRFALQALGHSEALASSALAGTQNAPFTLDRPVAARAIVRWDGVAVGSLQTYDMTYSNGLEPLNFLGGDEFPSDIDPGAATCTGSLGMRYQDQTWEAIARNGTKGELEVEWASVANPTTRLITFTMPKARLIPQGVPITGPGAMTASYQFGAEQTVDDPALIVTLGSAQAGYPGA